MSVPEPWLRGTLTDLPAVQRAVLHALELANEDLIQWCGNLDDEQVNSNPAHLPSVAFHIRHIARSIDRLLTYAEGKPLNAEQLAALETESNPNATGQELFKELTLALHKASVRIHAFSPESLEEPRTVGSRHLPTTIGGLLVHIAEHSQRHVGQAITTAKISAAKKTQGEILI